MRLVIILYNIFGIFGIFAVRKFNTCILKNQFKNSIKWDNYTHIVVCDRKTHSEGIKWAQMFLDQGIKDESICIIAPISKWMTQTPGYKTIISGAIARLENKVPIFIDWTRELIELNNIVELPTIIIVFKDIDKNLYEKVRVSGKYSKCKYRELNRD